MIRITTFGWVPPFVQGLVRDLRVRWALEEAGLPYEVKLLEMGEQETPSYRKIQPFGQVPAFEEDGLVLFETGAIVHHIARRSSVLMPNDAKGQARLLSWLFAALNTVEPHVQHLATIDLFCPDDEWAKLRRPSAEAQVVKRLDRLAARLEKRDYLEDRFTAADLMMSAVLRMLRHTDLITRRPPLDAFQRRCEDRKAFQKALSDQMASYAAHKPELAKVGRG